MTSAGKATVRQQSSYKPVPSVTLSFVLQFLSQDLPLFEGIVSDLFPGISLPSPDHGVLEEALKRNINKMGLQAVSWFIDKVIQVRLTMTRWGQLENILTNAT